MFLRFVLGLLLLSLVSAADYVQQQQYVDLPAGSCISIAHKLYANTDYGMGRAARPSHPCQHTHFSAYFCQRVASEHRSLRKSSLKDRCGILCRGVLRGRVAPTIRPPVHTVRRPVSQ